MTTWTRAQKRQIRQLFGLSGRNNCITNHFARVRGFESLESLRQTAWGVIEGDAPTLARMTLATGLDLDQRASTLAADAGLRERVQQRVRDSMDRLPERVDVTAMTERHRRLIHAGTGGPRYEATVKMVLDYTKKNANGRVYHQNGVVKLSPLTIVGDTGELQEQAETNVEQYRLNELGGSQVIDVKVVDWALDAETDVSAGRETSLSQIRMRAAHHMRIDGVTVLDYDTGMGTCVKDAITYQYGDPRYRLKKAIRDFNQNIAKAYHARTPRDWDYKPNYNPDRHGINCIDLMEGFCKPNHISMYVLDQGSTVVFRWVEPENRLHNRPSLFYTMMGNHMHLNPERARIVQNSTSGAAVHYQARSLLPTHTRRAGAQSRGDDSVTAFDPSSIVAVEGQDGREHMVAHARAHGVWPSGRNIQVGRNNEVQSYSMDGSQYVFNQQLDVVKGVFARMGWEWVGDTMAGLLWRIVEETYGRSGMVTGRPNPEAREVLMSDGAKSTAQCGMTMPQGPPGKWDVYDLSKSHAAALHSPREHWYVPGPHDHIERFNPPRKDFPTVAGIYYVTAPANSALFRKGTSWHSRLAVQEAHRTGVAFSFSAFLPCSVHMPADYFTPLVEKIVVACGGDAEIYKTLICLLSGYMGRDTMVSTQSLLDNSAETIAAQTERYVNMGYEPGLVQDLEVDDYRLYYFHAVTQMTELNTTVYLSILDNQSVALHRLERSVGGQVVMRKSDCTVISRPQRAPLQPKRLVPSASLPANFRAEIMRWGQFKKEEHVPKITCQMADVEVKLPEARKWKHEWEHRSAITDSNHDMDVVTLVMQKQQCLIKGYPGAGKTWMALTVASILESVHGLRVLKLAYTNMGALNTGGVTIDRGLGLKRKEGGDDDGELCHFGKKWLKRMAASYDVLLIDEISLIPVSHWVAIVALLAYKPFLKVILVGDEHQCSPVEVTSSDAHRRKWPHYFEHSIVKHAGGYNLVKLTKRHRSTDPTLNQTMDLLRTHGDASRSCFGTLTTTTRHLCARNNMRHAINADCNRLHAPKTALFLPAWTDTRPKPIDDQPCMLLHAGLPLQCQETLRRPSWAPAPTDKSPYFANNERFTVTKVSRTKGEGEMKGTRKAVTSKVQDGQPAVDIQEVERKIVCPLKQLQRYFRLGYATTVHSSQGATIKEPFTIWEWERMSRQLRYTAVSRAQRLDQEHLARPCEQTPEDMRAEAEEARVIQQKLRTYKRQDVDAGRNHPWSAYPGKEDVIRSLHAADYKCEHCQCSMRVVHKPGDLAQWTLQRKDNSRGHLVGNVVNYCLECNKKAPERSHMAALESDSDDQ
jgi:hypothetical protein